MADSTFIRKPLSYEDLKAGRVACPIPPMVLRLQKRVYRRRRERGEKMGAMVDAKDKIE